MDIFEKFSQDSKEKKPGVVQVEENIAEPVKDYKEIVTGAVVDEVEQNLQKKDTVWPSEQNPNLN